MRVRPATIVASALALPILSALTVSFVSAQAAARDGNQFWECTGPQCPTRDNSVSTFVGGNFTATKGAAEASGSLVVRGNLYQDLDYASTYTVGLVVGGSSYPTDGSTALQVGGNITIANAGRLVVNPSTLKALHSGSIGGAVEPPGAFAVTPDLAAANSADRDRLVSTSACVAQIPSTGTTRLLQYPDRVQFVGTGSAVEVFTLSADIGTNENNLAGIEFTNIAPGATVIVNASATQPAIFTNGVSGVDRERLLWNFPTAQNATVVASAQFPGSILTGLPAGTLELDASGLDGRVYAVGDLVHGRSGGPSGNEIHGYPFTGNLACWGTPNPGTSSSAPSTPTASTAATPSATTSSSITPSPTIPTSTTPATTTPSVPTEPEPTVNPTVAPGRRASILALLKHPQGPDGARGRTVVIEVNCTDGQSRTLVVTPARSGKVALRRPIVFTKFPKPRLSCTVRELSDGAAPNAKAKATIRATVYSYRGNLLRKVTLPSSDSGTLTLRILPGRAYSVSVDNYYRFVTPTVTTPSSSAIPTSTPEPATTLTPGTQPILTPGTEPTLTPSTQPTPTPGTQQPAPATSPTRVVEPSPSATPKQSSTSPMPCLGSDC